MSRGAPRAPTPAFAVDYLSARFRSAVTFAGMTIDAVAPGDPFTLTHTPTALVVRWRGDPTRELAPQVRVVPWCNVACAEPLPSFGPAYAKVDKR